MIPSSLFRRSVRPTVEGSAHYRAVRELCLESPSDMAVRAAGAEIHETSTRFDALGTPLPGMHLGDPQIVTAAPDFRPS